MLDGGQRTVQQVVTERRPMHACVRRTGRKRAHSVLNFGRQNNVTKSFVCLREGLVHGNPGAARG